MADLITHLVSHLFRKSPPYKPIMAPHSRFIHDSLAPSPERKTDIVVASVDIYKLDESDRDCPICREGFATATCPRGLYTISSRQKPPSRRAFSDIEEQQQPDIGLDTPLRLTCGHIFGKECLKAWLSSASTCPICRKDVRWGQSPLKSAHPELRLLGWRVHREAMILYLIGYLRTASKYALMTQLARRAQAFIERETGMEECPSWAMRLVCDSMACYPIGLVNGDMVMRTYQWSSNLRAGCLDLEDLGVSCKELSQLIFVVRLEIRHCLEIARHHGVELWDQHGCYEC